MAKRLYSVFARKRGEIKWTRVSESCYTKENAVRNFQSTLLFGSIDLALEMSLRVVNGTGYGTARTLLEVSRS